MSQKRPYLPFYPSDWISGTLGLSFELQGFYIGLICRMWEAGGYLPACPDAMSRSFQQDPRKIRRLLADLHAARKIEIENGKVFNRRVLAELEKFENRSKSARDREEIARRSRQSSSDVGGEFSAKKSETLSKSKGDAAPDQQGPASQPESTSKTNVFKSEFFGCGEVKGEAARGKVPNAWRSEEIRWLLCAQPSLHQRLNALVSELRSAECQFGEEALTYAFRTCRQKIEDRGEEVPRPFEWIKATAKNRSLGSSPRGGARAVGDFVSGHLGLYAGAKQ